MTAAVADFADPPAPIMGEVPIGRVRHGEPATEPLWVVFEPAWRTVGPVLTVASGWDGYSFGAWDRYEVEAAGWRGAVLTVRLGRDAEKVSHTPPGGDRAPSYEVSVVGGSGWCSCRGFCLDNAERRPCKHISALAFVVGRGGFSNPEGEQGHEQGERQPVVPGGRGEAGPGETGGHREADRLHPAHV